MYMAKTQTYHVNKISIKRGTFVQTEGFAMAL